VVLGLGVFGGMAMGGTRGGKGDLFPRGWGHGAAGGRDLPTLLTGFLDDGLVWSGLEAFTGRCLFLFSLFVFVFGFLFVNCLFLLSLTRCIRPAFSLAMGAT
jgi:hypothetical protein